VIPGPRRVAAAFHSGPLAVRSFRLLAGGQFASTIGDYCYAVALPWLVLSTHGSALLLGAVLACYGIPRTVIFLTVVQKWTPPALLGRLMGAIMLCAFGSYPLSVVIAGVLVRRIGPELFFPIAGGLVAVAILYGLTRQEFREFGAAYEGVGDAGASAEVARTGAVG
jgi:MFS family permease